MSATHDLAATWEVRAQRLRNRAEYTASPSLAKILRHDADALHRRAWELRTAIATDAATMTSLPPKKWQAFRSAIGGGGPR